MAVDTVIAQAVEAKGGFGLMALKTGDGRMGTDKRKAIIKMDLGDIIHQPVVGRMTSRAILTHCLLVDIGMAGNTISGCFRKDHGCVTGPAVDKRMLSVQSKTGGLVIEEEVFPQGLPA